MHHAAGKVERLPELETRAGRARKADGVKRILDEIFAGIYRGILNALAIIAFCELIWRPI